MALLEQPLHLIVGLLGTLELADERILLSMLPWNERGVKSSAVVPTALAVLELGTAVALEALGSCTANYSRPASTCQLLLRMFPEGCRLRVSRADGL